MATTIKEYFKTSGENLLKKAEELIEQGNITKIIIHNKEGKELAIFPLTVGVAGTVLAPVLAAIAAIATVISECTLTVEKGGR